MAEQHLTQGLTVSFLLSQTKLKGSDRLVLSHIVPWKGISHRRDPVSSTPTCRKSSLGRIHFSEMVTPGSVGGGMLSA